MSRSAVSSGDEVLRSPGSSPAAGPPARCERVEHDPYASRDRPGRHGRGRRVDRDQRAGELLDLLGGLAVVAEQHVVGAVELALAAELGDLAGEQPPPAGPQVALAPGLVEERQRQHARRCRRRRSPPAACRCACRIGRSVGALHLAEHGDVLADRQRADVGVLAALVVAAREVVEQVADRRAGRGAWRAPWRSCRPTHLLAAACPAWSRRRSFDTYQQRVVRLAAVVAPAPRRTASGTARWPRSVVGEGPAARRRR